jgi:hypothetical protein
MIDARPARGRRRRRNAGGSGGGTSRSDRDRAGAEVGADGDGLACGAGRQPASSSAIDSVSEGTLARLGELERTPAAITEGFLALWSDLLDRARLTMGCAVVAVSVAATGELLDTRTRCSAGGRTTWQGC